MAALPYDIVEAMIQCFGKCFHYKDRMAAFFQNCEVPQSLVDKHREEYKFVWARKVLTELGESDNGRLIQRKILTALCRLRNVPDDKVPDRDAGLNALRSLKELALQYELIAREEIDKGVAQKRMAEDQARLVRERAAKLEALRKSFNDAVVSSNRQGAGFSLEDILCELFAVFEVEYRKPFRTETQQIDGHFNFQGFDYLIEAKWRQDQPTEQELGAFKHKVEGKLESTRGLYLSIAGFREQVIKQFDGRGTSLILMDGRDLTHILEGRIDLRDGLKKKIEKAAQQGLVFASLYDF